ncbi:MAG: hypothetical protein KAI47_11150, partial [Deltaproteobacteria bacterium]|nr:hypothetical protein [Deltaproteobacteria bacterium]
VLRQLIASTPLLNLKHDSYQRPQAICIVQAALKKIRTELSLRRANPPLPVVGLKAQKRHHRAHIVPHLKQGVTQHDVLL